LSTYANSISWVADRVTSVASVFGWSKPTAGDSAGKMLIIQAPNHNTVDGDSEARPMSYLSKPGVVSLDGVSGTDYDEMDFSYICRKPAWFKTMTWPTSALAGDSLTGAPITVTPYSQVTIGGAQHYQPIAFVASFFRVWRGSLLFRFKVVRTEFHSGRLSVAFFPGAQDLTPYTGNPAYVHRQIIDIRESTEFEILVPFIHEHAWCYEKTGILAVTVVDPLSAPATVSTSISIAVEISAGEDFEVAMPRAAVNLVPTSIVPQSGLVNENSLMTMNIGNSTVVADPNISSATTIGDKISSFRAFLKRFTPLRRKDNAISAANRLNKPSVQIWSDWVPFVSTTEPANYWRSDHYGLVLSCYAISRGGIRLRDVINKNLLQGTSTNAFGPSMASVFTTTDGNQVVVTAPVNPWDTNVLEPSVGDHLVFQDLEFNGVLTAEIPQYTSTYCRAVCDQMFFQGTPTYGIPVGSYSSITQQQVWFNVPAKTTISIPEIEGQELHNIYRALADDGDFGCFISVPPMFVVTGSTQPRTGLY
jgi:hypothetical protein